MPVYALIDVKAQNAAEFDDYVRGHALTVEQCGGKFLVAGGAFEVIEGDWQPRTLVVVEWPDAAAFHRWYHSDEYLPWKQLRHGCAHTNVVLVEGLPAS